MKLTKFFALMLAAATFAVGCDGGDTPDVPEATGAITLEVANASIELGEDIVFTVMQEGKDVTAAATIYKAYDDYAEVSNPFTPTATGSFSFFATKGKESSKTVTVTVMASVPVLPEDSDPSNTKFNHRILMIDHTGVNCGNCPRVMDGLKALAETDVHNSYNEVCVHGGGFAPSGSDKAYSDAARVVDQFYGPRGYPNICFNFYGGQGDISGVQTFVATNSAKIKSLVKADGADAGVAVAASGDKSAVYVSLAVKAAVEQEYKVTAWLLENQIYNPAQLGTSSDKDYHKIHDFALRNIAGEYSRADLSGDSLGVIAAGEVKEHSFELPIISNKWVVENMDVLIIVSAMDDMGRFEVVNTVSCPVNGTVNYEYL